MINIIVNAHLRVSPAAERSNTRTGRTGTGRLARFRTRAVARTAGPPVRLPREGRAIHFEVRPRTVNWSAEGRNSRESRRPGQLATARTNEDRTTRHRDCTSCEPSVAPEDHPPLPGLASLCKPPLPATPRGWRATCGAPTARRVGGVTTPESVSRVATPESESRSASDRRKTLRGKRPFSTSVPSVRRSCSRLRG